MSLQLHRPDGEGRLTPRSVSEQNWRRQLRSPRWGTGLRGGQLPDHDNTEMQPTSRVRSLLFWAALGAGTFAILVVGYSTRFWG